MCPPSSIWHVSCRYTCCCLDYSNYLHFAVASHDEVDADWFLFPDAGAPGVVAEADTSPGPLEDLVEVVAATVADSVIVVDAHIVAACCHLSLDDPP